MPYCVPKCVFVPSLHRLWQICRAVEGIAHVARISSGSYGYAAIVSSIVSTRTFVQRHTYVPSFCSAHGIVEMMPTRPWNCSPIRDVVPSYTVH